MTLSFGPFHISQRNPPVRGPSLITSGDISIIVPVRDNARGIRQLLSACGEHLRGVDEVLEIVVVDDGSRVALEVPSTVGHLPIRFLRTTPRGPAHARNVGAEVAAGRWLLFTDSDCVPAQNWIAGFSAALNGSVAYAGQVVASGVDRLSRYYESQGILVPPPGREGYPAYVITANALVWRDAFETVGGFNDIFRYAAGEDIDLGLRLWNIGDISYAPKAIVRHDFEPSVSSFFQRFVRYGRGNRCLAAHYSTSLRPQPFWPAKLSGFNLVAALGQLAAMTIGYSLEGRNVKSPDWHSDL